MQYSTEELDEIIWQLEGGFPIVMEVCDYLDMIDVMKAQRKIQQIQEDQLLIQDLR